MINCTDEDSYTIDDCSRQIFENVYEKDIFSREHKGMWLLLGIPCLSIIIGVILYIFRLWNKKRSSDEINLDLNVSSRPYHYMKEISKVMDPDEP